MSIATKAAACAQCGKRLNRKHWYYRNGKYYCTSRCFETERAKAASEAAAQPAAEAAGKPVQAPAAAAGDAKGPEQAS